MPIYKELILEFPNLDIYDNERKIKYLNKQEILFIYP